MNDDAPELEGDGLHDVLDDAQALGPIYLKIDLRGSALRGIRLGGDGDDKT